MAIAGLKLGRQFASNVKPLSLSKFSPTNSVAAASMLSISKGLTYNPGKSSPTTTAAQSSTLIESLLQNSVAAMSSIAVCSFHAAPTAEPFHVEFRQEIIAAASSVAPASAPASPQLTAQLDY